MDISALKTPYYGNAPFIIINLFIPAIRSKVGTGARGLV